jgi:hypothetical protein
VASRPGISQKENRRRESLDGTHEVVRHGFDAQGFHDFKVQKLVRLTQTFLDL